MQTIQIDLGEAKDEGFRGLLPAKWSTVERQRIDVTRAPRAQVKPLTLTYL